MRELNTSLRSAPFLYGNRQIVAPPPNSVRFKRMGRCRPRRLAVGVSRSQRAARSPREPRPNTHLRAGARRVSWARMSPLGQTAISLGPTMRTLRSRPLTAGTDPKQTCRGASRALLRREVAVDDGKLRIHREGRVQVHRARRPGDLQRPLRHRALRLQAHRRRDGTRRGGARHGRTPSPISASSGSTSRRTCL